MKFYRHFSKVALISYMLCAGTVDAISLQDTLTLGLNQSKLLRKQAYQTEIAKDTVVDVRSSALPSLKGEIAYTKMNSFQTRQFTESLSDSGFGALFDKIDELTATTNIESLTFDTGASSPIQTSYTNKITFSQILFNGQAFPAIQAAKDYYQIQKNTEALTELQVMIMLTGAYLNLQRSQLAQAHAQKSKDAFKTHLHYVQARREQGIATNAEVLQAQVAHYNSEYVLIQSSKQLALAQLELNHMLNERTVLSADASLHLPEISEALSLEYLYDTALQNRLDLDSQRIYEHAKEKEISVANRKAWPTVAFVGSYGYGSTQEFTVDSQAEDWFLGVTGTYTFFDGFGTRAKKKMAKTALKSARIDGDILREEIEKDCVESYLTLQSQRKAFLAAKSNLSLTEELLKFQEIGYESGTVALRELLDAQSSYLEANLKYNDTFYAVITAYLQLEYHLGTLTLDKITDLEK